MLVGFRNRAVHIWVYAEYAGILFCFIPWIYCNSFSCHVFSAPIVQMVFQKKFDYDSFWFRSKAFEKKLYQILKVKKWKNIVPTYDKREYALKEEELEQVIHNMCHAEVTHEVIMLTGYFPVLLGQQISHWGILLMMSFLFSLVHLPFIFIQRYNRPRVIRLYKKANNHNAKEWTRSI